MGTTAGNIGLAAIGIAGIPAAGSAASGVIDRLAGITSADKQMPGAVGTAGILGEQFAAGWSRGGLSSLGAPATMPAGDWLALGAVAGTAGAGAAAGAAAFSRIGAGQWSEGVFDVSDNVKRPSKLFGGGTGQYLAHHSKRAANAGLQRFSGPKAFGAMGAIAGGAAAATVATNFMGRVADEILMRGSVPTRLRAPATARQRRMAATGSRVARRAQRPSVLSGRMSGDYSGIGATGDLVLSLHQTGGRGNVLR